MRLAIERYGITDTGPVEDKNLYILNDDATKVKVSRVMANIRERVDSEPDKNFLIVYVIAGYAMDACGK